MAKTPVSVGLYFWRQHANRTIAMSVVVDSASDLQRPGNGALVDRIAAYQFSHANTEVVV